MAESVTSVRHRVLPAARDEPELAYIDTGPPEAGAVVLLHSLGTDWHMWQPQLDSLAQHHRVLALDCRGHGGSGWDGQLALDAWVSDIDRVLAHARVELAAFIGISMGGIQAMAYAARHPQRVSSLVVADSFTQLDAELSTRKITTLTGQAERLGMSGLAEAYVADTFTMSPPPPGAWQVRDAIATMAADAYIAAARECFGANITDRLASVRAPTLVLWGERDEKTPRPLSERITAGISGARLQEVPHAGHLSNMENPMAFTSLVVDFLDARSRTEGNGVS